MAEASAVYRPRHPERTPFYQLFERHFDRYLGEYEARFEPRYGYLRPVVARTVSAFLECGRLQNGFARIRCPKCRGEHLLAFSCQTRNFCPSCQAKRAALVAEKLLADVLAPVPHRHLIFTIPKVLRGLFQRERLLLSILTRSAYDAVRTTWAMGFEDRSAPGSRTGSWARLLRRILEVDPLLCPRCGVEMKIVAVITEPKVVDAILRSLARGACRDPFAERAPPTRVVGGTAAIQCMRLALGPAGHPDGLRSGHVVRSRRRAFGGCRWTVG